MRKLLYALALILCNSAQADSVLLIYEPDASPEQMESTLTSFGLTVASYWESIHGAHVIVPCREAERWVRVLNQVRGVYLAEHNLITTAADTSPLQVLTCVPENEAKYDDETEILEVPQLYFDNNVYRAKLVPPFNIQELELTGELEIYQYDQ